VEITATVWPISFRSSGSRISRLIFQPGHGRTGLDSFVKNSVFITEIFPFCFQLPRSEGLQIPIRAQVRQPR
jgi:hypothetical protein